MRYRVATIHPTESITAAGTKTIDIKDIDPISRIQIRYRTTKTKHSMDKHGASDVTKIELVDGSDVLMSLTGYECQALNIYNRRVGTMCHGQHSTSNGEINYYGLDFGRFLWDKVLALDPKKFRNLQLKITYVLTNSDSAATAGELEVLSWLFDEAVVSPMGFLSAKEHYSFTPGADGAFEYIDMPTDMVMRKMMVRGYYDGREPWYELESFRIDEDNLKKIPYDITFEKYYQFMKCFWKEVSEPFMVIPNTTGHVYYITPTDYYASIPWCSTGAVYFVASWLPGGKVTINASAGTDIAGYAHGYLPNHCVEIPFGDDQDMDDWYDVTKIGSLRLRLESATGGASGTAQVVTEQLRKY